MTQQTYTPDWSKAPTDANWHARDSDGCGFWYNKRPVQSRDFWAAGCSLTIADNDCPVLDHDAALDNWRDTLTVRPFQDRDIPQNLSDYFTGKTPFITSYVDLLLARMAKEERFSDGQEMQIRQLKPFDVVISLDINGRSFQIVDRVINHEDLISGFVLLGESYSVHPDELAPKKSRFYQIRTITELEAVEFRAAMEAIYG